MGFWSTLNSMFGPSGLYENPYVEALRHRDDSPSWLEAANNSVAGSGLFVNPAVLNDRLRGRTRDEEESPSPKAKKTTVPQDTYQPPPLDRDLKRIGDELGYLGRAIIKPGSLFLHELTDEARLADELQRATSKPKWLWARRFLGEPGEADAATLINHVNHRLRQAFPGIPKSHQLRRLYGKGPGQMTVRQLWDWLEPFTLGQRDAYLALQGLGAGKAAPSPT